LAFEFIKEWIVAVEFLFQSMRTEDNLRNFSEDRSGNAQLLATPSEKRLSVNACESSPHQQINREG